MKKFDVITLGGTDSTKYAKVLEIPIQPNHRDGTHTYFSNEIGLVMDIFWYGVYGKSSFLKLAVMGKTSETLRIDVLDSAYDGSVPSYPIAYVRESDNISVYVACIDEYGGNVKCNIFESGEVKCISLSDGFYEPLPKGAITPKLSVNPFSNSAFAKYTKIPTYKTSSYTSNTTSVVISTPFPDYIKGNDFSIKVVDLTSKKVHEIVVSGGTATVIGDTGASASVDMSTGDITIGGLEWYTKLIIEINVFI